MRHLIFVSLIVVSSAAYGQQNPTDAVTPPYNPIVRAQNREETRQERSRRWDTMTVKQIEDELGWTTSDLLWWLITGKHPRIPSRYYQ